MKYSLAWPGQVLVSVTLWWQKNGNTRSGHVRLSARVAMVEGLLSVYQLRLVDEYCYKYFLNLEFARARSQMLCSYLAIGRTRIGDPFLVNYVNEGDS